MPLVRRVKKQLVVAGRKHSGELLERVCKTDPKWVTWMYGKASVDLPEDVFHELQDMMRKNGVPFEKKKRST